MKSQSNNNYMDCSQHTSLTGYQYGCRCERCTFARKNFDKERKQTIKKFILEQRITCGDCGWDKEPNLLHFHHVQRNLKNKSPYKCKSIELAQIELNKGLFLCPTCHAYRHYDKINQKVDYTNQNLS
jgi:hypothetical protein